jgi:hypothetical protein
MSDGATAPTRPLEPQPVLPRRQWRRPAAYWLLGLAVVCALITAVLAVRLGYRLADAGRDEGDFATRDPVLVLVIGAASVALFRVAERLGDF